MSEPSEQAFWESTPLGREPSASQPFDQAFWDDLYRSRSTLWSGHPNPPLVAEAAGLPPGAALDIGAGEGGDAIWLASRGWTVTAVDISPVALERAADHAARAGAEVAGRIQWLQRDVEEWEPPKEQFDLVSAHFFHLPGETRRRVFGRLADSTAPGGSLLVVGHCPMEGTQMPEEYFFTGDDIAALLDPGQWEIVTNAVAARPPTRSHAGDGSHQGPTHTQDAVLRARRRR
jgi:SAM-dependent methyltransferase